MCGRYYIDDDTIREIEKLVRQIDKKLLEEKSRDVFPSQSAPVVTGREGELCGEELMWGFPGFEKSRVIFNARQETALEKRTFRDSLLLRRCVIPAKNFYEWDKKKEKYTFTRPDGRILFFAGIYNRYGEEQRFVILTTQANDSMRRIHDRMPLILEERQVKDWIFSRQKAEDLLGQTPVMLYNSTEYEQQTLDLQ
ncbi:SOS response-associated peptidase [Blautia sp. NSJ-175]|uniref:SOS response-associated peptidase n=1 Tax=Blautia sp. NSJ-175 TaxID=2931396 RepID=UPI001FD1C464|nr:SOS response-associated peptidase [Blautia sp. NSJ-175]MCJ7846080.1 SOS response-associated peptidase [Blautia sp. NSJ-175]